jgi:hypothetical protein
MKVLICGSRSWTNVDKITQCIMALQEKYKHDLEIIEGDAEGADKIAGGLCELLKIRCKKYPITAIERRLLRNMAGRVRNERMFFKEWPDKVIAFHKDNSAGTTHMIRLALKNDVEVEVIHESYPKCQENAEVCHG